jgi:hypothetical protein
MSAFERIVLQKSFCTGDQKFSGACSAVFGILARQIGHGSTARQPVTVGFSAAPATATISEMEKFPTPLLFRAKIPARAKI